MEKIEEIKKLKSLLDQGAITNEEFNSLKKNVINQQFLDSEIVSSLKTNHSKTSTRSNFKTLIISTIGLIFILIAGVIVLNHANLIPTPSFLQPKQDRFGREYVYEDGKEIGKIVKRDYKGKYFHWNTGVEIMNIPIGKMWTPLYYEIVNEPTTKDVIRIFPHGENNSWNRDANYILDESKADFVSVKFSKTNYHPLTSKMNPAVMFDADPTKTCTIYYFEESIN